MNRAIKGLIIKDFKLIKSQMKSFFIIMILWGVFMTTQLNMATFFVGYVAVLCSFITLSTLNYDEFENGSAYLMTLPISRKDYIFGKYLFGMLITTIPFAAASMLSWVVLIARGTEMRFVEYFMSIIVLIPMAYLLLALEIPLQVKFGQEKSRMISVILIGGFSAGIGIISYMSKLVDDNGIEAATGIVGLGTGVLVMLVVAALAVLMWISYIISCRFMEKKEF